MDSFDSSVYTRSPVLTIASGITLSTTLADACPKAMPPSVKKACKKLRDTRDAVQAALANRQREQNQLSEADPRLIDVEADVSWGALRARLQSYATLPVERYPRATRAAELVVLLFGPHADLTFLQTSYDAQWGTMDTILKRIEEDKLQKDIDALAGPEFLEQIRHVHPRYEVMVKALLQRNDGSGSNLLEHLRALQRAIVEYATKVCATVDDEEPETITVAKTALRALDQFRQLAARRAGSSAGPAAEGGTPHERDTLPDEPTT